MTADGAPKPTTKPPASRNAAPSCPICGKPVAQKFKPFCSKHCANVDLNRWLNGAYVLAGAPDDDQDADFFDAEAARPENF